MNPSTLSPNHEKIAWAWLDNLMDKAQKSVRRPQRTQTVPADLPPAAKMTPQAREKALENAYDAILKMLKIELKKEIGNIQRAEQGFARQAGIDPKYFNWFLINGKRWPQMPRDVNRALRNIQNTYFWYAAVPSHWNDMIVPELSVSRQRDRAFVSFGQWYLRTIVPKLERKYVREVFKQSQDLVKMFRGDNAPRDSKAAIMLMRDFEKRLVADRFQLKPAIQELVDLFS